MINHHVKNHTDQLLVEMFHNYVCLQRVHFCRKFEIVAIDTDKKTFFNHHNYKTDIGQHLHKSEKIHQGGTTVTKQLIYFSNADNSTTLTPPGSPGVSRQAKLSAEFEFGSLVP